MIWLGIAGYWLESPCQKSRDLPWMWHNRIFSPWKNGSIVDFFVLMPLFSSSTILSPSWYRGRDAPPPACSASQFPDDVNLMLKIFPWIQHDEVDRCVTCSEPAGDCQARGEGCSLQAGSCCMALCLLLGTFLFQINRKKLVFYWNCSFWTIQSRISFCLLYKPSQGNIHPFYCNATAAQQLSVFYCATVVGLGVSRSAVLHVTDCISQNLISWCCQALWMGVKLSSWF